MNSSLPTSSARQSSSHTESCGNSGKPPSSSILWAHLLRKDVLASHTRSDAPLQPLVPADKMSTSTRILLLDTQAHLQRFGKKVDDLTSNVAHAKQEIVTANTLFQQDRESLMSDFVNLVNRSQLEIQKTIGKPAQASKSEDLQKIVELRLEGMDQRLVAMQMLSQTHSHLLQSQIQALQSLQEQQATIIGTIAPLVPLLQSIPLHIDSVRNNLTELLSKSTQSASNHQRFTHLASVSQTRKRSISSSSSSDRKRRRVAENDPLASHVPAVARYMPLPTRPAASPTHSRNTQSSATRPRIISALIDPKQSLIRNAARQPLAELPVAKYRVVASSTPNDPHHPDNVKPAPNPETPVIIPKTPLLTSCDPIARFRQDYVPPMSSKYHAERSPTVSIVDAGSTHQPSSPYLSVVPATMISRATPKQVPFTVDSKPKFKSSAPIHSRTGAPASSAYTGARKLGVMQPPPHHHHESNTTPALIAAPMRIVNSPPTRPIDDHKPVSVPTASSALRQRRSPFREGRRFIPLDDSDTSDDERQ